MGVDVDQASGKRADWIPRVHIVTAKEEAEEHRNTPPPNWHRLIHETGDPILVISPAATRAA